MARKDDFLPELDSVDREIRIEKLKQEINALAGGNATMSENGDCPPELLEQFLEHVKAFEEAERGTDFDRLLKMGITLPDPKDLDDKAITHKLEEVIFGLARLRVFLENTNHLSDRQLYADLWTDGLREETEDLSGCEQGAWHHDMIGSGSEEHTALYLEYYADDKWRKDWVEQFPEYKLPPRQKPPYDRDRHLPRPHQY